MKKILLLGLCIILLVPFISAANETNVTTETYPHFQETPETLLEKPIELFNKNPYTGHLEDNILVDWYSVEETETYKEMIFSINVIEGNPESVEMIPFIDNAVPSVYDLINFKVEELDNGIWQDTNIENDYDRTWINWITLGWLDKQRTKVKKNIGSKIISTERKWFKVSFSAPIEDIGNDDYGNLGRVGVLIDGTIYHPVWYWASNETVDAGGNVGLWTSIALNSTEGVHIAYRDDTTQSLKYCQGIRGAFTCETINDTVNTGLYTSIAINSTDGVHISYYDTTNGDLEYCQGNTGDWLCEELNNTVASVGRYTSIAINSTDSIHISFIEDTNDDLEYCSGDYGDWLCEELNTTGNIGDSTDIAINSTDGVHISYYDTVTGDLEYCQGEYTSWLCEEINNGRVGKWNSIAINSTDSIHISFFNETPLNTNHNIRYCQGDYGSWNCENISSDGWNGDYTSIAINSSDGVHISYHNQSSTVFGRELRYCSGLTGDWTCEAGDVVTGAGGAGEYTSIAIDERTNNTHISYYDSQNDDLKYFFANNNEEGTIPTHNNPILNSSLDGDLISENLTAWNQSTNGYGFNVKNIYAWYLQNYTIESLIMPFEKNNGTEADYTNDYSGWGNNANVYNATWNATGGYDGFDAYEFDGENDFIQVLNQGKFDFKANFSFGLWLNYRTSDDLTPYPLSKGKGTAYELVCSSNTHDCYCRFKTVGGLRDTSSSPSLNDGNWHHIACVHNGTRGILYFDGAKSSHTALTFTSIDSTVEPIRLGRSGAGFSECYNGTMDDVRIYNRSLSAEQIKMIFDNNTNFLSSAETEANDVFITSVTPISSIGVGETLNSSALRVSASFLKIDNLNYTTTDGFYNTTLNRYLRIDEVFVFVNDSASLDLDVQLNVTDPDGNFVLSDVSMINLTYTDFYYYTDWDLELSGQYNITAYVNNGIEVKTINRSIISRDAISGLTNIYNATVVEGSVQGFSNNMTYIDQGVASIVSDLIYNSTSYATSRSDEDSGYYYRKGGIYSQTGLSIDHFRWNFTITMDNGNSYTNLTTWYSVFPILPINVYNCTAANATWAIAYNFTLEKEMNDTAGQFVNQLISATLKIFSDGSINKVNRTFYENDSELLVCVEQAPYNNNSFQVDGHIEYSADNYDTRNYFLVDNTMNNQTQNISLYLLEIPFGTETRVFIQDQDTSPLVGYYTKIQRYYVDENAYKVVAMLRSDQDGRDIVYLREDDAWYRFLVEYNNEVVYVDQDARKISRDEGYTYATIYLTISTVTTLNETLSKFDNIEFNLSFNNVTNNFVAVYSDTTGGADEYCLFAYKSLPQNDTFICDICSESTSATLVCNVGAASNGTYIGYFYAKGSEQILDMIQFRFQRVLRELFGIEGLFPSIFLIGTASFVGAIVGGTVGVIVFVLGAMLLLYILGIAEFSLLALMGLVALGIAIIIGLRQRGG